jgi:adenosine/AMP kinase
MANRLTRGEALVGSMQSDAETLVGTDLHVADDVFVQGALGYGVAVNNIADGASMIFTATNLLEGIITATPTATRNLQAPAAADIITAVDANDETGIGFDFTVINLASATHVLTLTVNTGTTIVGLATIQPATSATFVARLTTPTTVVIYRK